MKSVFNFLMSFFESGEYIGLSSFKKEKTPKIQPKIQVSAPEKTALTGLLKRV